MIFTIKDVQTENNVIYVSGSTLTGSIKGVWKSDIMPIINRSYNVELAFTATDRKSITISRPPANTAVTGDMVVFTGLCESIDEIYYIRFSYDGLEMLDVTNDDFTIKKGDYIYFSKYFHETEIYPY